MTEAVSRSFAQTVAQLAKQTGGKVECGSEQVSANGGRLTRYFKPRKVEPETYLDAWEQSGAYHPVLRKHVVIRQRDPLVGKKAIMAQSTTPTRAQDQY